MPLELAGEAHTTFPSNLTPLAVNRSLVSRVAQSQRRGLPWRSRCWRSLRRASSGGRCRRRFPRRLRVCSRSRPSREPVSMSRMRFSARFRLLRLDSRRKLPASILSREPVDRSRWRRPVKLANTVDERRIGSLTWALSGSRSYVSMYLMSSRAWQRALVPFSSTHNPAHVPARAVMINSNGSTVVNIFFWSDSHLSKEKGRYHVRHSIGCSVISVFQRELAKLKIFVDFMIWLKSVKLLYFNVFLCTFVYAEKGKFIEWGSLYRCFEWYFASTVRRGKYRDKMVFIKWYHIHRILYVLIFHSFYILLVLHLYFHRYFTSFLYRILLYLIS